MQTSACRFVMLQSKRLPDVFSAWAILVKNFSHRSIYLEKHDMYRCTEVYWTSDQNPLLH